MKPNRIILIRHGESEGNIDPQIYRHKPDHLLRLTDAGRAQALEAGKALRELLGNETVHAYVSPYARTRETFKTLANGGLAVRKMFEEPRLREQDWGHLRGPEDTLRIQDERYQYGTFYYRFPDGESGADVYDRVSTFLETLYRDFQRPDFERNALLVTHGLTIRLFVMRWFHESVETFETWKNPKNCEPFVMELRGEHYHLVTPLPC